jgi:hypothetical protein
VHYEYIPPFDPEWLLHLDVFAFLVSAGLLIFSLLEHIYMFTASYVSCALKQRRNVAIAEKTFATLLPKEKEILGYLLHHNQRVFECTSDGGYASTLLSRRFVRIFAVAGQQFDYFSVPFIVDDDVWTAMRKNPGAFPYIEQERVAPPWRKPL